LGLTSAVFISIVVALVFQLSSNADYKGKYVILQGFYPSISQQIDSAYILNKDSLISRAQINIVHQAELLDAENNANQAIRHSEQAKKKVKRLKERKIN